MEWYVFINCPTLQLINTTTHQKKTARDKDKGVWGHIITHVSHNTQTQHSNHQKQ